MMATLVGETYVACKSREGSGGNFHPSEPRKVSATHPPRLKIHLFVAHLTHKCLRQVAEVCRYLPGGLVRVPFRLWLRLDGEG